MSSGARGGKSSGLHRSSASFIFVFIVIFILVSPLVLPVSASGNNRDRTVRAMQAAPLNPEFLTYLESSATEKDTVPIENGSPVTSVKDGKASAHAKGLIPGPVSRSYLAGKQLEKTQRETISPVSGAEGTDSLPGTFDLRDLDRLTPVKDQGNSGSCWAFATIASAESYLLPGETTSFSENNMKNTHGYDWDPNEGGNIFISTAYLARWSGPVNESDDPYDPLSNSSPVLSPVKHVQDVYYIPSRTYSLDNDNIKAALASYGALYVNMYMDERSPTYNSLNHSYYYSGGTGTNHAVAIVGWNDSYSRYNFGTTPAGDGAFIVKNSWSTTWGEAGYFYVSYYDTSMGYDSIGAFTSEPVGNYTHIYQYDWLGNTVNWGFSKDIAWFASNYTASSDQLLTAAGFYTPQVNSEYEVKVYRDGELVQSTTGTIEIPGYHTVSVGPAVTLEAGQPFRIEIGLYTPGYNYPVAVEVPFWYYSSGATANYSESFWSPDGIDWYDTTIYNPYDMEIGADVCLKAYTREYSGTIGFSEADYSVFENNTAALITVSRDNTGTPVSVDYHTTAGNASLADFTAVSGTLDFSTDETSKTFAVPVVNDTTFEWPETVRLTLTNATNFTVIRRDSATLTILDDDGTGNGTFRFENSIYTVTETDTQAVITVVRDNPGNAASVDYDVTAAGNPIDFTPVNGTLNFAAGEKSKTFTVQLINDNVIDGNTTVLLKLTNATNNTLIRQDTATLTITDDDLSFKIELVPGWNLISSPVVLEDDSVEGLFNDSVQAGLINIWGWNESEQNWEFYSPDPDAYFYRYYPEISKIKTGKAYWVEMNTSASICFNGTSPDYSPNSSVRAGSGWNFVGTTGSSCLAPETMYPDTINIWGWNESEQNWEFYSPDPDAYFYRYYPEIGELKPGHGYWVEMA